MEECVQRSEPNLISDKMKWWAERRGGEGGGVGGGYEWGREIPSAVLKVNTDALWPHQSAGLLCSPPLPRSSSFLPSPALRSSPLSFSSHPALCPNPSLCFAHFTHGGVQHHSPSSFLLPGRLSRPACLPACLPSGFPFLFVFFFYSHAPFEEWSTPMRWALLSPLSLLHVGDCVRSMARLSPNSP